MNKRFPFVKFHGAGNDFILIDNRDATFPIQQEQIAMLCDRHYGVGADGLILIENPRLMQTQFYMRYFNSDGKEATLCGNGSRCAVAFVEWLNVIDKKTIFETVAGVHVAEILYKKSAFEWIISLQMHDVTEIQRVESGFFVNTGSPHFVISVNDVMNFSVATEGEKWRNAPHFKQGTNVDFIAPHHQGIFVRTYERGVENETLSCGTGVVASALVWSVTQKMADGPHTINVFTRGGGFQVNFDKKSHLFTNIFLIGTVVRVFDGQFVL